jgi:hypothetical protein
MAGISTQYLIGASNIGMTREVAIICSGNTSKTYNIATV